MRAINKDDFIIATTAASNVILRWKHNKRRIKLFNNRYNPMKRAISYRDFLIRWYADNNYQVEKGSDSVVSKEEK